MDHPQAVRRSRQGLLLSLGAPLGWLGLRWIAGFAPPGELAEHPQVYVYMLVATAVMFWLFGRLLGRHEDRLRHLIECLDLLSITDPLTGLKNRRYFFERLYELCERETRSKTPFVLAIVDLDHFKKLNDRFGHLAGDRVLRAVAQVLTERVRRTEVVARIGGEEFGLLFSDSNEAEVAQALTRLLAALERRVADAAEVPETITVTASAGFVSSARLVEPAAPSPVIAAADRALYRAKALGRNRVERWDGAPAASPIAQRVAQ